MFEQNYAPEHLGLQDLEINEIDEGYVMNNQNAPNITDATLSYQNESVILTLNGENLSGLILNESQFDFPFDFGGEDTTVTENVEGSNVILERSIAGLQEAVPEYGCRVAIKTISGFADFVVTNFEGITTRTVNELANGDDVLLVLDATVYRAVDLTSISHRADQVPLVRQLINLGKLLLDEEECELFEQCLMLKTENGANRSVDEDIKYEILNQLNHKMKKKLTSQIILKTKRPAGEKAGIIILGVAGIVAGVYAAAVAGSIENLLEF